MDPRDLPEPGKLTPQEAQALERAALDEPDDDSNGSDSTVEPDDDE